MERCDIAVVGLGALGSAAAYHAASRGVKIIGLEQFEFGHVRGASHDTSRIVRTSYEAAQYVALAKSAYKDWAALEKASGQKLLDITGGVTFLKDSGKYSVSNYARSLEVQEIPFELLDHKQVQQRFPQFNIPADVSTVYTADTGIVHASKSVGAMQHLARSYGATLREKTRVDRITPQSGGVVLDTSGGQIFARKVILATDAWTNKLLKPLKAEIPLTVMQEQVTYFKPSKPQNFEAGKFPVWIWGIDNFFYGFPCYGESTIKAARDVSNNFVDPDARTFVHSPELLNELIGFMDTTMPDKGRQVLRTVTCQYTITPDRQFILSSLDNYQDIVVGLGAAHGFKFAPAIGRVLVELALDGKSTDDLSHFGIPKTEDAVPSKL